MNPIPGLQDIQGLDAISWWPLALGWWILIGFLVAVSFIVSWIYVRRAVKCRSWQHRILGKLDALERELGPLKAHETAVELAELIRRLAIQRYSRKECANLNGEPWLKWLAQKDPAHFDWPAFSRFLIEAPFVPKSAPIDLASIKRTIKAAKGWVK